MIDGSVLQSVQRCFEKKSRVVVKMVVTELNSQRDALESVRNVNLRGKVCRVATGSNLIFFFVFF